MPSSPIGLKFRTWAASNSVAARLARLSTTGGLLWLLVQFADRFGLKLVPQDTIGIVIFALCVGVLWLSAELLLLARQLHEQSTERDKSPADVFADGIVQYARELGDIDARRDSAVLELRGWSTRILHLMGKHDQRAELGQIALTAASALDDQLAQASILTDELGWTLHLLGDDTAAIDNLDEALVILKAGGAAIPPYATPEKLLDLQLKAERHRINIKSSSMELTQARGLFTEPRNELVNLSDPLRRIHKAQLNHSEAELIARDIDRQVGPTSQVDPTGSVHILLVDALALATAAENDFRELGDKERVAKALGLRVQLLAHERNKQRFLAAQTQLTRIKQEVARQGEQPSG